MKNRQLIWILAILMISACTTPSNQTSTTKQSHIATEPSINPEHIATAERFLVNIGAGELAMASFEQQLEIMAIEQPGMSELVQRAFKEANVGPHIVVQIASKVYAKHLSHGDLLQLEQYSQQPEIQRFFRSVFDSIVNGTPPNNAEIMNQFTADELVSLLQFSQSESFLKLNQSFPIINREMTEEAQRFRNELIQQYIDRQ